MKKLMIAAAIVCAAAMSQAAAIYWKSGANIAPGGTAAASGTIGLYVFILQDDPVGTEGGMTAAQKFAATNIGDIWGTYGKNGVIADIKTASTYNGTMVVPTAGATATQQAGAVSPSTTYYALILTTYDAAKDGTADMYAANKMAVTTNGSGAPQNPLPNDLSLYIGGQSSGGNVKWETVPEPTSGLLLLLGVAGLALRRKQK